MELPPLSPLSSDPAPITNLPAGSSHQGRKIIFGILGLLTGLLTFGGAFAGYQYHEAVNHPEWSIDDISTYVRDGAIQGLRSHISTLDTTKPNDYNLNLSYSINLEGQQGDTMLKPSQLKLNINTTGYIEPKPDITLGAIFDAKTTITLIDNIDRTNKGGGNGLAETGSIAMSLDTLSPDGENLYFKINDIKITNSNLKEQIKQQLDFDMLIKEYADSWYVYNIKTDTQSLLSSVNTMTLVPIDLDTAWTSQEETERLTSTSKETLIQIEQALKSHTILQGVKREKTMMETLKKTPTVYDATLDKEGIVSLVNELNQIRQVAQAKVLGGESPKLNDEIIAKNQEDLKKFLDAIDLRLMIETNSTDQAKITLDTLDWKDKDDGITYHIAKALKSITTREKDQVDMDHSFQLCDLSISSGSITDKSMCTLSHEERLERFGKDNIFDKKPNITAHIKTLISPEKLSESAILSYIEGDNEKGNLTAKIDLTTISNNISDFNQSARFEVSAAGKMNDTHHGKLHFVLEMSQKSTSVASRSIEAPQDSKNFLEEIQSIQTDRATDMMDTGELPASNGDINQSRIVDAFNMLAKQGRLPESNKECLIYPYESFSIAAMGDNYSGGKASVTNKAGEWVELVALSQGEYDALFEVNYPNYTPEYSCNIKYIRLSPSYYGLFFPSTSSGGIELSSDILQEFSTIDNAQKIQAFRSKYEGISTGENTPRYTLITP